MAIDLGTKGLHQRTRHRIIAALRKSSMVVAFGRQRSLGALGVGSIAAAIAFSFAPPALAQQTGTTLNSGGIRCSTPDSSTSDASVWVCVMPAANGGSVTVSGVPTRTGWNMPDFDALKAYVDGTAAPGAKAIFIGDQATRAYDSNTIAIGNGAVAGSNGGVDNEQAIAVGKGSVAGGSKSIAIGATDTQTNAPMGDYSGHNAQAVGTNGVSIGTGAGYSTTGVSGGDNIAIGHATGINVTGATNTAIGSETGQNVTGNNNVGIGEWAGNQVSGIRNTAIGVNAGVGVSGQQNTAIGRKAGQNITTNSTTSIGDGANAAAMNSVAIGLNATTTTPSGAYTGAVGSTAIGSGFLATQAGGGAPATTAVAGATASGAGATAIGSAYAETFAANNGPVSPVAGALASGARSLALGSNAQATQLNAVATGSDAVASGENAIAIGKGAQATKKNSISVGTGNKVSGEGSGAFGDPNDVSGAGSYAFGNNNTIAQDNTFVLGNDVTTTQANSVVLGNASTDRAATAVSSATVNGVTYGGFAGVGSAANGVVSIGAATKERQLINVAAGAVTALSTDAINGSQLYATNFAIGNLATSAANALGGGVVVNADGSLSSPNYTINGATYTNVGAALAGVATHYYSVNDGGTQGGNYTNNGATGPNTIASGVGAVASGKSATAMGSAAAAGPSPIPGSSALTAQAGALASGERSTAIGTGARASSFAATALGTGAQATNYAAIAVGQDARATREHAIAIGFQTAATERQGVAIGNGAKAQSFGTIAIGGALSDNDPTMAPNQPWVPVATGPYSAVSAVGDGAIAIGASAKTNGDIATAMGPRALAIGEASLSLGAAARAALKDSVALGSYSAATTASGIAGYDPITGASSSNTSATWRSTLAAVSVGGTYQILDKFGNVTGTTINSRQITNVAAGMADTDAVNVAQLKGAQTHYYSVNSANVAAGSNYLNNGATGTDSMAMGVSAVANKTNALAAGTGATASGASANAIGSAAAAAANPYTGSMTAFPLAALNAPIASGLRSNAIGSGAVASGYSSIAFGSGASAATPSGIAIGEFAKTTTGTANGFQDGVHTISIGYKTNASGRQGVAIGTGATASHYGTIAIGGSLSDYEDTTNPYEFNTTGQYAPVRATGAGAIALGASAFADGRRSVALGSASTASTEYAVAIGDTSKATQQSATALGYNSSASVVNGVALGSNSLANTGPNVAGYDPTTGLASTSTTATWSSKLAAVSVGTATQTRQINNLAAGAVDTDAVNVAQLKAVNAKASAGWNVTTAATGTGVVNGTSVANVAPGATHTITAGDNIVATQSGTTVALAVNPNLNVTSVTTGNTVMNTNGVTIGAAGPAQVALTSTGLNNGGNKITNVGAGSAPTDAVNVSQLGSAIDGVNMVFGGNSGGNITLGSGDTLLIKGLGTTAGTYNGGNITTVSDGTGTINIQMADSPKFGNVTINDGGSGQITGVTAGSLDTDAVNVSQLEDVRDLASKGWTLTANNEATGYGVGPGGEIDVSSSSSNLTVTQDANNGNLILGMSDTPTFTSVTTGNTVMNTNGVTIGAAGPTQVALTGTGLSNGGNKITNVGAGSAPTDAVNVSQLGSAIDGVNMVFGGNSGTNIQLGSGDTLLIKGLGTTTGTYSGGNITTVSDGTGTINIQMADSPKFGNVTINDGGSGKITGVTAGSADTDAVNFGQLADVQELAAKGWDVTTGATGTGVANGTSVANVAPGATHTITAGDNIVATQNGTEVQLAVNPNLNVTSVTAGNTVMTTNGVTIGAAGPTQVALTGTGLSNGGNTITNVGAGLADTDAVNVSQLKDATLAGQNADERAVKYDWTDTDGDGVVDPGEVDYSKATLAGTNGTTISNLADGAVSATSSDAINGSQLYGTAQSTASALGGNATVNPDGTISAPTYVTTTGTYNNVGDALLASNTQINQVGSSLASGLGGNSSYNPATGQVTTSLNVGATNYTTVNEALNALNTTATAGWNVTTAASGTGVVSGTSVANVAPGSTHTITAGDNIVATQNGTEVQLAVNPNLNVTSVTTGNTVMNSSGVTIGAAGPTQVALTSSGLNNGGNKLTNVGAGTEDTDGVNYGQLKDAVSGAVASVNIGFGGNEGGPVTISSGGTLAIKGEATTTGSYSGANIKTVTDPNTGAVNIQMAESPKFGNVTVNDGGTGKITGVTAGTLSDSSQDAVNGSQLVALGNSVASSLGGGSTYNANTNTINTQIAFGGAVYNTVQGAFDAVSTGLAGGWNVTTGAVGSGVATNTTSTPVKPGETMQITAGNNIMVNQNGKEVQVALNPNLKDIESIQIAGGPTINGNGINMNGDRITNVGNAIDAGDAVNLGQMQAGMASTLSAANTYTDQAVGALRYDMAEVRRDANGGTASAMAMTQVPQAFEPGMGIMGMGVSTWQGEQAVAIGFSKASDSGRVVVKASGTYNTRQQAGAAVGFGIQF